MKKYFYISKIETTGPGKTTSSLNLFSGLNIIYGPSNTGKSYIVECIDFIFGSKENPFLTDETGYNTVFMEVKTNDGSTVTFSRVIGSAKIDVVSNADGIDNGKYNTKEIGNIFLHLIGITPSPKIVCSQDYRVQNLTWRTILHTFLLKESDIFKRESVFTNSHFNNKTAVLSALLYFCAEKTYANENKVESKEIQEAKKVAVVQYINSMIKSLSERKGELSDQLLTMSSEDIERKIRETFDSIATIEIQISAITSEIRKKSESLLSFEKQLQEDRFLLDRYMALATQYRADLRRAEFIIDGEAHSGGKSHIDKCPFCANDIPEQKHRSYKKSAEHEVLLLRQQLEDLLRAKAELEKEIDSVSLDKSNLSAELKALSQNLSEVLQPTFSKLKNLLDQYQKALNLKNEIEFIEETARTLNADVQEAEQKDEPTKYDAVNQFDNTFFSDISTEIDNALRICNYPGYLSSRLTTKKLDVVVNGQEKASEGKGFRAYLNTVVAFSLMKYLSANAKFAPNMLILDSPILSLSEKSGNEGTSDSMKVSLFQYLKDRCGSAQIIVVENNIPDIDYTDVNLVPFSKDKSDGRYGFLLDISTEA